MEGEREKLHFWGLLKVWWAHKKFKGKFFGKKRIHYDSHNHQSIISIEHYSLPYFSFVKTLKVNYDIVLIHFGIHFSRFYCSKSRQVLSLLSVFFFMSINYNFEIIILVHIIVWLPTNKGNSIEFLINSWTF